MTTLASLAITAAQSAVVTAPLQLRDGPSETMAIQANFTYGSGGTTVDAWVQTSLDGGGTWCDVANFHFTAASARAVLNASALTVIGSPLTPTDGSMAANSSLGGLIGSKWRVKYTTVGTYAGGTALQIDAQPSRGRLTL